MCKTKKKQKFKNEHITRVLYICVRNIFRDLRNEHLTDIYKISYDTCIVYRVNNLNNLIFKGGKSSRLIGSANCLEIANLQIKSKVTSQAIRVYKHLEITYSRESKILH